MYAGYLVRLLSSLPPNTSVHELTPHPDDGQPTLKKQQTVMRQEYTETTTRGVGLRATHC